MSVKRFLCLLLASASMLVFTACGNKGDTSSKSAADAPATSAQQETAAQEKETAGQPSETIAESAPAAEKAIPGKLYQLNTEAGEEPIITSLRLVGNRVGTEQGINGKKAAAENIRAVFELNEWIEIYPVTTVQNGLSAAIAPHSDDLAANSGSFTVPEKMPVINLEKPGDENSAWGSLYLNPEDASAGYYDLVILSNNKPVAFVMIKMYNEAELAGKSDVQLEQMI